jgi:LysW-gamma-L-alpha-aminoadipyl-6-phosphate/LysW-L-glutamyl-5-phosphate reductase
MLKAGIVGASGYVGSEILSLLMTHPHIEVTQVTSESNEGKLVSSVHPNLRKVCSLKFIKKEDLTPVDLLFICLPHGHVANEMDALSHLAPIIVDTSADFRLHNPELHTKWYGEETLAPQWRDRFVYGLPELEREKLKTAKYISGVGCNATTVNLGLWPLAKAKLIDFVVADVKASASEGGAKHNPGSHYPERANSVRSFAPTGHRHQAEICQQCNLQEDQLYFSVTGVPMVRGVLATLHVFLKERLEDKDVRKLYFGAYKDEPFVRLVKEREGLYLYPEPRVVVGTNFCEVGWKLDDHGKRLVVLSAIDNLVKGAAGSAIQCANLACGFEETEGLKFIGLRIL